MKSNCTVAPVLFGGASAPTLMGLPGDFLPQPLDFRIAKMETLCGECVLHFKRKTHLEKLTRPGPALSLTV
jgi:riboflavin biosynthesis pyrimidine reductase